MTISACIVSMYPTAIHFGFFLSLLNIHPLFFSKPRQLVACVFFFSIQWCQLRQRVHLIFLGFFFVFVVLFYCWSMPQISFDMLPTMNAHSLNGVCVVEMLIPFIEVQQECVYRRYCCCCCCGVCFFSLFGVHRLTTFTTLFMFTQNNVSSSESSREKSGRYTRNEFEKKPLTHNESTKRQKNANW